MREYSINELVLMSTNSAKSIPVSRHIRPTGDHRMNAKNIAPTDKMAQEKMDAQYHGKRKPALVLTFIDNGKFYRVNLGPVRMFIRKVSEGGPFVEPDWITFIQGKGLTRRAKLSAHGTTAAKAAYKLFSMDRWFFDGAQWRSMTWVYRSIVMFGIANANKPKGDYETSPKSGKNLHVPGIWIWDAGALRKPLQRVLASTAPNTPEMYVEKRMPDIRTDWAYDQNDADKPPARKRVGDTWVVKAPVPKGYTGKDPNPHKIPGEAPKGVPMREWMNGEFDA